MRAVFMDIVAEYLQLKQTICCTPGSTKGLNVKGMGREEG